MDVRGQPPQQPPQIRLVWWSDAMSPWTLVFKDPALEADFLQLRFPCVHAPLMAIGTPVVTLLPTVLAIREFWPDVVQPTPAALWRRSYVFCFIAAVIFLRLLPILLGIRHRSTARYHFYYSCAMYLRLVTLLYLSSVVIFVALHCHVMPKYSWISSMIQDTSCMWCLMPLIAALPFRVHLLLVPIEAFQGWMFLSSCYGVCGMTNSLLQTTNVTCAPLSASLPVLAGLTSSSWCGFSSAPPSHNEWMEPVLRNFMRHVIKAPSWAVRFNVCEELALSKTTDPRPAAQQLVAHFAVVTKYISTAVGWVVGDGPYHRAPTSTTLGQCQAFMSLVVLLGTVVVGSMLYHRELGLRTAFYNQHCAGLQLAPPAAVLSRFVLLQQVFICTGLLLGGFYWCRRLGLV